jgi:SAM-dependent methyltransferase
VEGRGELLLSFDRASHYYDRTRALSARATQALTALLAAELRGREPCLEIGVGTGRIALPLAGSGLAMVGVDVSLPMLAVLVEKGGGRPPLPAAAADARLLPFPPHAFGSALCCHVLHLFADWRGALAEVARVVRPGGVFLVDLGGWGATWWQDVASRFSEAAGIARPYPGVRDAIEVDTAMLQHGAGVRELPPVVEARRASPGALIDRLEEGLYSFTWQTSPAARRNAAAATRAWAEGRFDSLEEARAVRLTISWRAYDLP